jgi:hypothetical protein
MPPTPQGRGANRAQVASFDLLSFDFPISGRAAHRPHHFGFVDRRLGFPARERRHPSSTENAEDILSDRFAPLVHFEA